MTLPAITRLQLTNFEVLKTTTACLVYMSLVLLSFNWFLALQIKISQIRVQPWLNYNLSFCMQSWYYGLMMLINPLILFVISTNSWFILLKAENIIFCKKNFTGKTRTKTALGKQQRLLINVYLHILLFFIFASAFCEAMLSRKVLWVSFVINAYARALNRETVTVRRQIAILKD